MIVEDEQLIRDALSDALTLREIEVVTAGDIPSALEVVDRDAPDIAILDIRLPPSRSDEGLQIAEILRGRYPEIGLVLLSSFAEVDFAERLLSIEDDSRSLAYLLKDRVGSVTELVDVLQRVAAGHVVIDPQLIDKLMKRRRTDDPLERLTPHERRILALVAEGRSNLGIAQLMNAKVSTVEKHLSVITEKLGLPASDDTHRRSVNVRVLAVLAFLRSHDGGRGG